VPGQPIEKQSLWARIAHVVHVKDFPAWLNELFSGDAERLEAIGASAAHHEAKRIEIAKVRDRMFTYEGTMRRIAEWLDDPATAELKCQGSSYL
jgi:hypothetical protein